MTNPSPSDQNVHKLVIEVLQCPFRAPEGGGSPPVDIKEVHRDEAARPVQLMCVLGYNLLKTMVPPSPQHCHPHEPTKTQATTGTHTPPLLCSSSFLANYPRTLTCRRPKF